METPTEKQSHVVRMPTIHTEDTPRQSFDLKEHLDDFVELSEAQLHRVNELYANILASIPYNGFLRTCKILKAYEDALIVNGQVDILNIFNNQKFPFSAESLLEHGGTCLEMAMYMKNELKSASVDSYLVPYQAGGTVNTAGNIYMGLRHGAIVVSCSIRREPTFILADVGFGMNQPITFRTNHSSEYIEYNSERRYVNYDSQNPVFPYQLRVDKRMDDGSWKNVHNLPFNPYIELANPEDTVLRETNRTTGKFRLAKQDADGKTTAAIIFDIVANKIVLLLHAEKGRAHVEIEAINLNNLRGEELSNIYQDVCEHLHLSPEFVFEQLELIARHRKVILDRLLAPSVRKELSYA